MAVEYKPVIWYRSKLVYDAVLLVGVALYIYTYLKIGPMFQDVTRPLDGAILRMRAFGSCAFLMLTIILCIGPLARLDKRFLPLLYNRRHFGVITFIIANVHASYVLGWYFAFSSVDPYAATLGSNDDFGQILGFPFEILGVVGLLILMILAFTSHDFWLSFLGPPVWKTFHMMVYVAYAAIVFHVALGALQSEASLFFTAMVTLSVFAVCGLHLWTGLIDRSTDTAGLVVERSDGWIIAGKIADIEEDRAITVPLKEDERVAIFRYDGKLSAIVNACAHQNGPLGEGRIIDGCVTCPWHGYQYRPQDGCAPAPFTEKIATYNLKLEGDTILLDPKANPPGTPVDPILIAETSAAAS